MKSYFILIIIPILFAVVFASPSTKQNKTENKAKDIDRKIDSLRICNEALVLEIQKQTDVFKENVVHINKRADKMMYQLDTIDTVFQDTIVRDSVIKKKSWFKKTMDKIIN